MIKFHKFVINSYKANEYINVLSKHNVLPSYKSKFYFSDQTLDFNTIEGDKEFINIVFLCDDIALLKTYFTSKGINTSDTYRETLKSSIGFNKKLPFISFTCDFLDKYNIILTFTEVKNSTSLVKYEDSLRPNFIDKGIKCINEISFFNNFSNTSFEILKKVFNDCYISSNTLTCEIYENQTVNFEVCDNNKVSVKFDCNNVKFKGSVIEMGFLEFVNE